MFDYILTQMQNFLGQWLLPIILWGFDPFFKSNFDYWFVCNRVHLRSISKKNWPDVFCDCHPIWLMQETAICVDNLRFIIMWYDDDSWLYYIKLIRCVMCQFVQISPKDLDTTICIDETMSLNSIDKFYQNVILPEAGILPQIQSSVDCMIFTSDLNKILKQHLSLKKKYMYVTKGYTQSPRYWPQQLPSGIRSHPYINHSSYQVV